jgi:hypothetical protein
MGGYATSLTGLMQPRERLRSFVVQETLPSGGETPLAAVEGTFDGQDGLLIGNNSDGALSLFLDGTNGLELASTFQYPNVPNPTGLAIDSTGAIYATTDGVAAAFPIILGLGASPVVGEASTVAVAFSAVPTEQQVILLQPLTQTSLALVATLLSVSLENSTSAEVEAGLASLPNQPFAQGRFATVAGDTIDAATQVATVPGQVVPSSVTRFVIALNDAFAKARLQVRDGSLFATAQSLGVALPNLKALDKLLASWSPLVATIGGSRFAFWLELGRIALAAAQTVDATIESSPSPSVDVSAREATPLEPRVPTAGITRTSLGVGMVTLGMLTLAPSLADHLRPAVWPRHFSARSRKPKSVRNNGGATPF